MSHQQRVHCEYRPKAPDASRKASFAVKTMYQLVSALLLVVSCITPPGLAVTLTSDQAHNSEHTTPQQPHNSLTRPIMMVLLPGGGKGRHLLSVTAATAQQLDDSPLRHMTMHVPKATGVWRLPGGGKYRLLLAVSNVRPAAHWVI